MDALTTSIDIFLVIFIPLVAAINEDLTIETKYGWIKGSTTDKSQVFLGIPYADPPDRWADAKEPKPMNGTVDATKTKPMCYQPECHYVEECVKEMSEDCLYLNIFAPLGTKPSDNKAVMVWIHGGYFVSYTGAAPIFNGEQFVHNGDVILVTINYRLGAFGFLMTGTDKDQAKGNHGIRDQRLALKWINENINGFGGNPSKVTIFGESAGASSVMAHLIAEDSRKYFHQVIIQSAPLGLHFKSIPAALKQTKEFCKSLGCSLHDDKCLRSKSPDDIIAAQKTTKAPTENFMDSFMPWGPFVDGIDIKTGAIEAAKKGVLPDIPLIIGTTFDETIDMVYRKMKMPVPSLFSIIIVGVWKPSNSGAIVKNYPFASNSDTRPELVRLSTDFIFNCPSRVVAESCAGFDKTWMYVFNQSMPINDVKPGTPSCATHACHSAEIPYVFSSFEKVHTVETSNAKLHMAETESDVQLGNKMVKYWTNFAKNGDPNGDTVPQWSKYKLGGTKRKTLLVFSEENIHSVAGFRKESCDFWDKIGYD